MLRRAPRNKPSDQDLSVPPGADASVPADSPSPTSNLVRVEKNLASLGFFTPSNKRIKGLKAKTVIFSRQMDGRRVEVKAVILPSAAYGLPITSDQDKYLAFQKIISEIRRRRGAVKNPVGFTSAEMLRILALDTNAGKNYVDILEWGKRMTLTGISSQGVVYFAGRKTWASDTFHVFERFVSVGNQMPDGTLADRNYVWLSEWQLENINQNHLMPIDLETYKQLKNHISKALVPLLQVWLFASLEGGCFEKRYRDLCQILNITEYPHLSKIKEKLGRSLDELKDHGYLSGWRLQEASDGKYKILLYHGAKFHRDQANRLIQRHGLCPTPAPCDDQVVKDGRRESIDKDIRHELMRRGISEKASSTLTRNLRPDQQVKDQLEWGDNLLRNAPRGKFHNPAGLYIHLIKENVNPPETFETSRKRTLREAADQAREQGEQTLARITLAYLEHKKQELDTFISENYSLDQLSILVNDKRQEFLRQDRWKRLLSLDPDQLTTLAERQVRAQIAEHIHFLQFDEFRKRYLREGNARPGRWQTVPGPGRNLD